MEGDIWKKRGAMLRGIAVYLGLDIDMFCHDSQVTFHIIDYHWECKIIACINNSNMLLRLACLYRKAAGTLYIQSENIQLSGKDDLKRMFTALAELMSGIAQCLSVTHVYSVTMNGLLPLSLCFSVIKLHMAYRRGQALEFRDCLQNILDYTVFNLCGFGLLATGFALHVQLVKNCTLVTIKNITVE